MAEPLSFRRNIGLFMAVMIGIGAMMGPGIFALPGELAHMIGPLGVVVYLAMGLVTVLTALNYSELGAAIPLAGGGYSFTSRTLPRPVAFYTGWFFWIGNTLACAMYAVIFALTIRGYFWSEASLPLLVLLTTVVFGAVNLRGMSEAIKVITVMNLVELAVLVGFAVLGAMQVEPRNLTLRWAAIVATIMASLSAFSVTLGASARVLYALGRDGHFPQTFATLHRQFRTPHVALAACAVAVVTDRGREEGARHVPAAPARGMSAPPLAKRARTF